MGKGAEMPHPDRSPPGFLASAGELGRLIEAFDWAATPLGPLDAWPQSLRTAVSLIRGARHPMWIGWGKEATFLYNDAYVDVLGAAKHPWALGRPASEVWSEIWDVCGPLADKVFQRAEATFIDAIQLFMRRGDFLEETWYSFSYSPILGEDGRVGGLFCPSTEVSASVLNARRLGTLSRLSADALREPTVAGACATAIGTLADNPADLPFVLLYVADADGKLRLRGTAGLPDADADAGPFPVAQACRDGMPMLVDLDGIGGLPAGLSGQPLRQALVLPLATPGHGGVLGALVLGVSPVRRLDAEYRTFFDLVAAQVTAAIQNAGAIEEQRRRVDMLAELDRAKTAFFSNVSHEFRTPLTLMLGPIEDSLADADQPLPDAQRERLQLVRRNALRLERLVNTLLDFSRVQAGRMQANVTPADLAALTADLASGFRSVIESAGLVFDVRCAPLPRPVRVDVGMWEKIVLNLLSNAFKFTFDGAISVTVESSAGAARVTVRDTGIGIAPEHLDAVFERFQRIEGARSRSNEGSGIGLALVRDLVELQGGTIAVESAPGRGSAFIVTLPFAPAGGPDHGPGDSDIDAPSGPPTGRVLAAFAEEAGRWLPAPPAAPAPRRPEEPVVLSMARVLVADDNADMRDYLARLLGQHWEVSVAADGVDALAMVRRERPDVVVADVMMPRLDGFGLIARLRADRELADTPVVLVSARAGEEARIEGLEKGANDYLVKPFGARELITRVESQVMQARMRALERAHAARLASIFRQVPAGIAIVRGPRHVFELVNDHYQGLVGPRPILNQPLLVALPELAGQGIQELLDGVRASGRPYVGRSERFMLARGAAPEERFFDFVYQPILDARGAVEAIAIVAFEVTELARARREAEVANRAKDDFLAMLGHELRNPLAPILIALELIRARRMPGHERELAIMERQARHLVRLVDDLLDVARIARGKIELRPERVELGRLVALAVEANAPLLAERSHHLLTDVAPSGLPLHGDPVRLTQVLSNLLTNAAKYTNPGGRIHVRAWAEDSHAVLQVEDNGIGISPGMLPRLFDKFVQERQALDRSRGGLGLGLAIVREIVALHGGTVTARSPGLGHGSVFELRLPLADACFDPCTGDAGARPARRRNGLRVLLVDDNADVLEAMRGLLELGGHAVTALGDPQAALALPDEYTPDIALLDIGLPGLNGYELLAALRARPGCADTDFIALSGYGQPEDRARSLSAGFCAHLVKPPAPAELAALLDALGQRRVGAAA
ncbi:ATP-binding protein [Massilia putida]|uniref:ATP-binding protein n=1 Tax=Massilia putida TaxID=1141883 RepID=UPI000AFB823F|nr:ATP-binding protein [Massilia putida]